MRTMDEQDTEVVKRLRREGVLWWSYLVAIRHVVSLAVPGMLVSLPLTLIAMVCAVPLFGDSLMVVNGRTELVGADPASVLGWSAAVLVASVAGYLVVFPATVVLAAGRLAGRPVSVSAAMRLSVRRLPAMLVLAAVAVAVFAATVGAVFWVLATTEDIVRSVIVMMVPALLAMPALLAVPAVVLEGRSALRAVGRAYRLTARRYWPTTMTLVFGGFVLPALAGWAADAAVPALPQPIVPIAWGVTACVLGLIVTPLQASVVAGLFITRLAIRYDERADADLVRILQDLPAGPVRPLGWALPVAMSLLPGLLYGGAVLADPFGWAAVRETVMTGSWRPGSGEPHMSYLRGGSLRGVYVGPDTRTVALTNDVPALLSCVDPECDKTTYSWAEPVIGEIMGPATASARLADGRFVVTLWRRITDTYQQGAQLELLICDARGCAAASDGTALLSTSELRLYDGTMRLAPRPDGGLILAYAEEEQTPDSSSERLVINVVVCPDLACGRPSAKEIARIPMHSASSRQDGFTARVGPDGRLAMALMDHVTGAVQVLSCETPVCDRIRVTRPVAAGPERDRGLFDDSVARLSLAVRADGRPIIVYRDMDDGAIRLLDCLTWDCARASTVTLAGAGEQRAAPVLMLDRAGRTLVAYQDLERRRIMLATCDGGRCARTPVAAMRNYPGSRLALTLDGQGRPVIAWEDGTGDLSDGDWQLMLSTVLRPR